MAEKKGPMPWKKLRSEVGPTLPLLKVRYEWMENPRNQRETRALVLDSPDWVNIVAITPEKKVVVVRQYRFGTDKISTEIPGGLIDPGEDDKTAAMRELQEETGFTSEKWRYLGYVEPNPAFLSNRCHQWLAEDAVQNQEPSFDDGEDIVIDTLTLDELGEEIQAGTFRHSLAMMALVRPWFSRGSMLVR